MIQLQLLALLSLSGLSLACEKLEDGRTRVSKDGFVSLSHQWNEQGINLYEGNSTQLECVVRGTPRYELQWYRLKGKFNESTAEPIRGYWLERHYYQISHLEPSQCGYRSQLTIHHFSAFYDGAYFCRAGNGEVTLNSPIVRINVIEGSQDKGTTAPEKKPALLLIINATLEAGVLRFHWRKEQRNENINYCTRFDRLWSTFVQRYNNWTEMYDTKRVQHSYFDGSIGENLYTALDTTSCEANTLSYFGVVPGAYYKLQVKVNRDDKKNDWLYASKVFYFGEEARLLISYPNEGQTLTEYDPLECKATGSPPPRVSLFKVLVERNNFTRYTKYVCTAQTFVLDDWMIQSSRVSFRVARSCQCERKMRPGVCDRYVPVGSLLYTEGRSVMEVEEELSRNVANMTNSDCLPLLCRLKLPSCDDSLDDCTGEKGRVCAASCDHIKKQCSPYDDDDMGNCAEEKEAGTSPQCYHLVKPLLQPKENYTDGSCLSQTGQGLSYTGTVNTTKSGKDCISWSSQKYFPVELFSELDGNACRNPAGSGDVPWCYVSVDETTAEDGTRWEYCAVDQCPMCVDTASANCLNVPGYNQSERVFNNSLSVTHTECDNATCNDVIQLIFCHLSYPPCLDGDVSSLVSYKELCSSTCAIIKDALTGCNCGKELFKNLISDCGRLPSDHGNGRCAKFDVKMQLSSSPPQSDIIPTVSQTHPQQRLFLTVLGVTVSLLIIAVVIIIVVLCCCYHDRQRLKMHQTDVFLKPIDPKDPMLSNMHMCTIDTVDCETTKLEKESLLTNNKGLRPISKSKIQYIRHLGSGNFGLVYQGKVEGIFEREEFTMAAIKTLRDGTSADGLKSFLHEAKLACQFNHENIIKLYGICMSNDLYCLVFEYMDLGDLNEYLRANASSTQRRLMNPLNSSSRYRTESSLSYNPPELDNVQLVSICHQIALGMEYFASLGHVHRDLATRNCLVSTGLVVKIGDFGMSQTLYHMDYYKQRGEQALPVRWMAPEAFIYGKFSTEGDVWSFGVVMWEVFSFAMQPYYGKMNDQVMNEVRRGKTLEQPDDCPSDLFEIMRRCWRMETHQRPTFSELIDDLHSWKPTHSSTSTAGPSLRDCDSISSRDKDLDSSVFDGDEEDYAN